MADLPCKHHGYFPQRLSASLPQVSKSRVQLALEPISSETCLDPASAEEESSLPAEHPQNVSNHLCNGKMPSEQQRPPATSVAALLKRIRVHPEAQRILGNPCIPVVNLQRLNFQAVSSLQPVVALVRLPEQAQAKMLNNISLNHHQQNGLSQTETDILEIREDSPESKPAELSELSQPGTTPASWAELYCSNSPPSEEPEQGSDFDHESNLEQPYILLDSASDEWDPDGKTYCETFYLDPDPEHTTVIQLDPEGDTDQDRSLELQDGSETKYEADTVQIDDCDYQRPGLCCSQMEDDSSNQEPEPEPEPEPGTQEVESEDFCAVCLNGGDLLCCDRCPKVYHLACHIPQLVSFPLGEWVCTLCRSDLDPVEAYDCENVNSCGAVKVPYTLSSQDQRRCEKLTLLLYCHLLSAPFHEPVSPLAQNYYQIIKRPIDLSVIRRKLDKSNTVHYFSAELFVDDVLLMFRNCATFNYPDSEVAQAGQNLEVFFLSKLKEIFPERTFPMCSQDGADRAHLRWLSGKRKEHYRKRRHVFSGKKYYL